VIGNQIDDRRSVVAIGDRRSIGDRPIAITDRSIAD
jgi:hypothetical protein